MVSFWAISLWWELKVLFVYIGNLYQLGLGYIGSLPTPIIFPFIPETNRVLPLGTAAEWLPAGVGRVLNCRSAVLLENKLPNQRFVPNSTDNVLHGLGRGHVKDYMPLYEPSYFLRYSEGGLLSVPMPSQACLMGTQEKPFFWLLQAVEYPPPDARLLTRKQF